MYIVVFRTIAECSTKGSITWTPFTSEQAFTTWYNPKMQSWYEVVAKGVTKNRAKELASSPETPLNVMASLAREAMRVVSEL